MSRYHYLLRSCPGELLEADGVLAVVRHFGWKRVGLIYTKGKQAFVDRIVPLAPSYGVTEFYQVGGGIPLPLFSSRSSSCGFVAASGAWAME